MFTVVHVLFGVVPLLYVLRGAGVKLRLVRLKRRLVVMVVDDDAAA